jgi:hypothetical protein
MLNSKVSKWKLQPSVAAKRWSMYIKFIALYSSLVRSNIFLRVMPFVIMAGANKMIL